METRRRRNTLAFRAMRMHLKTGCLKRCLTQGAGRAEAPYHAKDKPQKRTGFSRFQPYPNIFNSCYY